MISLDLRSCQCTAKACAIPRTKHGRPSAHGKCVTAAPNVLVGVWFCACIVHKLNRNTLSSIIFLIVICFLLLHSHSINSPWHIQLGRNVLLRPWLQHKIQVKCLWRCCACVTQARNDPTRFCGRCRMQKCLLFNKQQLEEEVHFYDVWCLPRMRLWVTITLSDDKISNCSLLRTIPTAKCCLISIVLVATTRNIFFFYILIRSIPPGTYS